MRLDEVTIVGGNNNAIGSVLVLGVPSFLDNVFEVDGGCLADGGVGCVRAGD